MFTVHALTAAYGSRQILTEVNFTLRPGTLTGLLGANGSGKTTLLKALCGILPHGGTCSLNGMQLEGLSPKQRARCLRYVPSDSGIFMPLTAGEVVEMGFAPSLGLLQQPTAQMRQAAEKALRAVGLEQEALFSSLSQGQKQLCLMARASVMEGALWLLDEPESALDVKNRYEILGELKHNLKTDMALAALHDPQLALNLCDEILILHKKHIAAVLRPGKDACSDMEDALSSIYGAVRLYRLDGSLAMVKEGI